LDSFGYPVALKYKKETEYRSVLGGCITFIILIGLVSFFGILLHKCLNNQSFEVVSSLKKMNQTRDRDRKLILNKDNFDIALSFNYVGENKTVLENLE
jgi:hypothetical protein